VPAFFIYTMGHEIANPTSHTSHFLGS